MAAAKHAIQIRTLPGILLDDFPRRERLKHVFIADAILPHAADRVSREPKYHVLFSRRAETPERLHQGSRGRSCGGYRKREQWPTLHRPIAPPETRRSAA